MWRHLLIRNIVKEHFRTINEKRWYVQVVYNTSLVDSVVLGVRATRLDAAAAAGLSFRPQGAPLISSI